MLGWVAALLNAVVGGYSYAECGHLLSAAMRRTFSMLDDIAIPQAIPAKKVPGYQMPEEATNLLSWEFVSAHMIASHHY